MNCLFKKPGGFFVALLLVMSAHAAFDKHKLQSIVPSLKNSVFSALSEQEQMLYRACKPDPAPCFQIQKKIWSIKKDIQECCDLVEERVDEIIKKVEALEFCERPTPIRQTDIPFTVTASGSYCLAEDVSTTTPNVAITIDTEIVSLDLHGFSISGGNNGIAGTGQDIVIKNGTIKNAANEGILLTTCTTVEVSDIIFQDNVTGLKFDNVHGMRVSNLSFTGHTTAAMNFNNGSRNGKISCVNMFGNTGAVGINVHSSSNLVFDTCTYSKNDAVSHIGFNILNSSNCNFLNCLVNNIINDDVVAHQFRGFYFDESIDCFCHESQVTKNQDNFFAGSTLDGFVVTDSCEKIIFDSCLALENTNSSNTSGRGFVIENSNACCALNCAAKTNTVSGFRVENSTNCYHANNIAQNSLTGYVLTGTGNNIFFSNYASVNGTNYSVSTDFAPRFTFDISAGTFTPVAPRIAPVTKWDNISTTP